MKLSTIINDDSVEHKQELTNAKFIELLKSRAKNSHYIAKQNPFFRQDKGADMMLVTPSQKEERSSFWVDKLIKLMPSWSKLPSRSRFVKAYTSYNRAAEQGGGDDIYVMIPYDSSRIGVAPGPSFYKSFGDINKSLGFDRVDNKTFLDWLETIQDCIGLLSEIKIEKTKPETFSQFKKCLDKIDKVINKDRTTIEANIKKVDKLSVDQEKIMKDLLNRHVVNTEQYIMEKLDPEVNGFHATRVESYTKGTGDHEVWVDKECLLIKRTKYIEMVKNGVII